MYNLPYDYATLRNADLLEEARREHLLAQARKQNKRDGEARNIVAVRLGSWLIAVGRRLQGQESAQITSPQVVILSVPSLVGSEARKQ